MATWGDSYVSDSVWMIRFGPWVNKVASQQKIAGDSLCNCIKLDFMEHFLLEAWNIHEK